MDVETNVCGVLWLGGKKIKGYQVLSLLGMVCFGVVVAELPEPAMLQYFS